jgi:phage terminase small subunit
MPSRSKPKRKPPGARAQHDPDALTNGQLLFAQAYLENGCNGARAYRETHPKANNQTCQVEACRLLREPKVRAFVDAGLAERRKRMAMEGDEAIALLSARARANLTHAYDGQGKLLPFELWPIELQLALKSHDGDKVTLHDGLKAAELMARATGRLKDSVDLTHKFDHAKHLAGIDTPPPPPED